MKVSGFTPIFIQGKIGYFRKYLITFFTNIHLANYFDFQLPECKLITILVLNIVIIYF